MKPGLVVTDYTRRFGARLYYEGKNCFWNKNGGFSINYLIGVGIPILNYHTLSGIMGLGMGYSF